jgi:hypothetical protein
MASSFSAASIFCETLRLVVDKESPVSVKTLVHSPPQGAQMRRGPASPSDSDLSEIQLDAIKLIASGCTARYAALVLKIKFSEVNKWLTQDKQFKAAVAEQMKELQNNDSPEIARIKPNRKSEREASTTKRSPG